MLSDIFHPQKKLGIQNYIYLNQYDYCSAVLPLLTLLVDNDKLISPVAWPCKLFFHDCLSISTLFTAMINRSGSEATVKHLLFMTLFSRGHRWGCIHETLFLRFVMSCFIILSLEIIDEDFIFASP